MTKYLLILIISISTAAAENKIAFLKGKASINGKQVNSKQVIQYGDSIKTGRDSLAVLIIQPGTTLKLKSNSEMIIKKPRISKTINSQFFILKTGEALVKV